MNRSLVAQALALCVMTLMAPAAASVPDLLAQWVEETCPVTNEGFPLFPGIEGAGCMEKGRRTAEGRVAVNDCLYKGRPLAGQVSRMCIHADVGAVRGMFDGLCETGGEPPNQWRSCLYYTIAAAQAYHWPFPGTLIIEHGAASTQCSWPAVEMEDDGETIDQIDGTGCKRYGPGDEFVLTVTEADPVACKELVYVARVVPLVPLERAPVTAMERTFATTVCVDYNHGRQ